MGDHHETCELTPKLEGDNNLRRWPVLLTAQTRGASISSPRLHGGCPKEGNKFSPLCHAHVGDPTRRLR
jgi:hypothetical protein